MTQESGWRGLLIRAALVVPLAIIAVRSDVTKFRAWRERIRRWRAAHVRPPPEYQRDNELWRWRVASLIVSLGALAALILMVPGSGEPQWLFWSVYGVAMIAASWNVLGQYVR